MNCMDPLWCELADMNYQAAKDRISALVQALTLRVGVRDRVRDILPYTHTYQGIH